MLISRRRLDMDRGVENREGRIEQGLLDVVGDFVPAANR